MPLAAENLSPDSSSEEIQQAISDSIATCIREGNDREQCAAIAYRYATDKTGKPLSRGTTIISKG